jgi:peptidoglycan hydrolase-like protein with peptidoglycan-binding domain
MSADASLAAAVDAGGDIWTATLSSPAPPAPAPAPAVVSSGGGWSGGCSTYPQGELPSWGVIPCTPTNPSQGPAVSPGTQPSPTPTSSLPPSANTTQLTETQIQSILSLLASFGADQATINNINSVLHDQAVSISPSLVPVVFTRNLELHDTGDDILALQKFFNTHGFPLTSTGPGSPGSETSIFGTHTYQALIKFQTANNLPATGYLGPLTRAALGSSTSQ